MSEHRTRGHEVGEVTVRAATEADLARLVELLGHGSLIEGKEGLPA
jgi:hypothetical protein